MNAGVLSATFSGKPKEGEDRDSFRARILSAYIESSETVGSIDHPGSWIKDEVSVRYGVIVNTAVATVEHATSLAFFGGVVEGTHFGLIGSPGSLVGAAQVDKEQYNHGLEHYTINFLKEFSKGESMVHISQQGNPIDSYWGAIDSALSALPAVESRVEFLAKTLHAEPGVLLATPIYVALAD